MPDTFLSTSSRLLRNLRGRRFRLHRAPLSSQRLTLPAKAHALTRERSKFSIATGASPMCSPSPSTRLRTSSPKTFKFRAPPCSAESGPWLSTPRPACDGALRRRRPTCQVRHRAPARPARRYTVDSNTSSIFNYRAQNEISLKLLVEVEGIHRINRCDDEILFSIE